jgi:hypothetical protein
MCLLIKLDRSLENLEISLLLNLYAFARESPGKIITMSVGDGVQPAFTNIKGLPKKCSRSFLLAGWYAIRTSSSLSAQSTFRLAAGFNSVILLLLWVTPVFSRQASLQLR